MPLKIHATHNGIGSTVVLIHGLFGMGSNLGALSRALAESHRVYSVDLPNHGRSDWLEPASIPLMADAIQDWMDSEGLSQVALVGHSLGGKVAMEIALRNAGRVAALVVADIAPVAYKGHHQREFAALKAVAAAGCQSRSDAARIMAQHLDEEMVIQFLLKNLVRGDDGCYAWRFNLEELINSYEAMRAAPSPGSTYDGPVLFIKGGDSNYILERHRDSIVSLFPNVNLKVIPGAGHWLHAEQPRLFNSIVRRFLSGI